MDMIDKLLNEIRLVSTMVDKEQLRIILKNLLKTGNIEGSVVEFGCNIGTTSVFIQSVLKGRNQFHVYDSFEGFPEKDIKDKGAEYYFEFKKGAAATTVDAFRDTFKEFNLPLPVIHQGWFKNVTEIPEKISFAFFDSDFYSSIMDSWKLVYPRLSKGAIVCIHDYNWDVLPGVTIACDEFLSDKPEKGTIEYNNYIGTFTKL